MHAREYKPDQSFRGSIDTMDEIEDFKTYVAEYFRGKCPGTARQSSRSWFLFKMYLGSPSKLPAIRKLAPNGVLGNSSCQSPRIDLPCASLSRELSESEVRTVPQRVLYAMRHRTLILFYELLLRAPVCTHTPDPLSRRPSRIRV